MTAMHEGYTTPEGHWIARPLLMPEARSFSDVFSKAAPYKLSEPHSLEPVVIDFGDDGFPKSRNEDGNHVGPFCRVSARGRRWYLDVRPTDAAVDAVRDRIVTPDDNLSWEIIEHEARNRALVILEHGYIIGSHWLAYIDPSTIPSD